VEYVIQRGNEDNLFELDRKYGVWTLNFRHRITTPETFYLDIESKSLQSRENSTWEKPLVLRIKLIVTE